MMDKDMVSAPTNACQESVKRLLGTGIKLSVVDKVTGQSVNYGVQLNNTTLEIEALPNLKVSVNGYSAMYEALKEISEGKGRYSLDRLEHASNTIADMKALAIEALSKAEEE